MELKPHMISRVVERLAALADESRIRLLLRLREGQANVSELTAALGIAQASVSKHLAVLRRAGLVDCQRRGTQSFFFIRDDSVFDMCRIVCDGVMRQVREEHAALGLGKRKRP